MSSMVKCAKLGKEAEALTVAPYPGPLGQRILQNISKPAWQMWLKQQTMLINENRLSLIDPKARQFLEQEMEKFFFTGDSKPPAGFVPK